MPTGKFLVIGSEPGNDGVLGKGYSLSFKSGSNTTINPPVVDKKTSILIKGMTLVQNGGNWQPTGGTVTYTFLGQKGTGNLMDFVAP